MRRPLVFFPSPILHQTAKPIASVDDGVRALLNDMVDTMYAEDGVGLAAPQIGVGLRAVVIDLTGALDENHPGLLKMVNPEIVQREGEIAWEEGCLSVPDFRRVMKRAKVLTVRFLDEDGTPRELHAQGLLAIAVQQEIDHLDGKLIIDDASRIRQDLYLKKRKRLARDA